MKIAVFQPTFLPYPGYFGLIDYVEKFVIMDNVQFEKSGWQQRVLINLKGSAYWLTLPVKKKNKYSQLIKDVEIYDKKYIKKHLLTIKQSYCEFPFYNKFYPEIEKIYKKDYKKLLDFNLSFIYFFCEILDINKNKLTFLSDMQIDSKYKKDDLIYEICNNIKNTKEYIASIGAEIYLKNNKKLNDEFKIKYFSYSDKESNLFYNNKYYNLSIIDLIFKHGEKAKDIIKLNFFCK